LGSTINVETEVKKIVSNKDQTLGRIIDIQTEGWFEPKEKLSKLSIAMEYEAMDGTYKIPDSAEGTLKSIQDSLGVKGERPEKKVFEELDKD